MDWLQGKQVALTGKFASMTRAEVAELIRTQGGRIVSAVNPHTAFLIVGQETWPLQNDGRLNQQLRRAQDLQHQGHPLSILAEEELLARLGQHANGVHRHYTLAQLVKLLGVPRQRIHAWIRAGLIQPAETANSIPYFSFREVIGAKTLSEFATAGISIERIRQSLQQLKNWLADAEQPLEQLALLEKNGQLLVRLEQGLVEPSGQMYLDFEDAPAILPSQPTDARQWFESGCLAEREGALADAAHAYRQALLLGGPHADVCYNLANVLFALDQKAEAGERFRQVVEIEPNHGEAWNNLGIVLCDQGRHQEAIDAFQHALQVGYQDAHYNLADCLDSLGQALKARSHWAAYLRHDPYGPWARHARKKLAQ